MSDKKDANVESPESFVNKNINTDEIDTAIAITKSTDGRIQLSRNSKMDLKVLTDTLVLAITEMCKDPAFKHSFLESFSSINGAEDLYIKRILDENGDIRSAEDTTLFLQEILDMIRSQINPTGLALMLTNVDAQELANNPETEVPVIMQFSGAGNTLAYMAHEFVDELSGKAYSEGKPNAFDPSKDKKYANLMRDFRATLDMLESDEKTPDNNKIKFKVEDKDKEKKENKKDKK